MDNVVVEVHRANVAVDDDDTDCDKQGNQESDLKQLFFDVEIDNFCISICVFLETFYIRFESSLRAIR